MLVRSCKVTIQDMEGVAHTVEVTAATLYEAVAQVLAAIRGNGLGRRGGAGIECGESVGGGRADRARS
jgi:hypothetical protein